MSQWNTLHQIVQSARAALEPGEWDYLVGGADTESALKRNRYGLDSLVFRPRILNDVSDVDCTTTLLGVPMNLPLVMPPIGSIQAFHPDGAEAVARAAAQFGVLQILSSVCQPDFETLASRVPGPRIFQLYLLGDQAWMDDHIARAIAAGYTGFCLTADTQVYSRRERDISTGYVPLSGRLSSGRDSGRGGADMRQQARMTWDTIGHIKNNFDLPLIIKGVNVAEDARHCVEMGVDVVYVSNHGGRQLDHTRACIDALPEVVQAVDGQVPILVDGGFLRGADVVKALCLGASAVGMGRMESLALAAGGEPALLRALELVHQEVCISMALAGASRLSDLRPELLERATPMTPPSVLSAFPLIEEGY